MAGVGICGCITSFQPFENISEKMGHFGGMSGHLGAVVGAPEDPWMRKLPLPDLD